MDGKSGMKKRKKKYKIVKLKLENMDVYPCDQCEYTGSKVAVYQHRRSKHEGIRYSCDQCEYSATERGSMKKHKQFKHKGIRYLCDQCDFSCTTLSNLKRHEKSVHKGIRYPCDQCQLSVTDMGSLKRHTQSKHDGIRYPCNQCEYSATRLDHLKKHKESKHKEIKYPRDLEFEFIEISPINIAATEIKKEESTEDDPLEDYEPPLKKEKIEDEEIAVKEELEYKDCDLVTKIEIVDDMMTINLPHQ